MKITQDTLTAIYDAAVSEKMWAQAMDACTAAMGAELSLFYEIPTVKQVEYSLEKSCSAVERYADAIAEHTQNVASGNTSGYEWEGVNFIHKAAPWSVVRDDDIWDLSGDYFDRPEITVPLKSGLFRRSFVNLSDDPLSMRGIVFLYGREYDDHLPTDLLLNGPVFAPHVSKAADIFRLTDGLRRKYNAVLTVLDRISTGVLIVSDKGDIIVQNSAAEQLLQEADGLKASASGHLLAADEATQDGLRHSIAEISSTARGENDKSGTVVQIPRRSTGVPLVAVVSPLRDADMEIERGLVGALVTIIDPLRPVDVQSDLVATAYGLTKAEARVAGLVLRGLSNVEISEQIGVSPETIKSQISAILAKSGCKSRVALIWRVFQLAPPID